MKYLGLLGFMVMAVLPLAAHAKDAGQPTTRVTEAISLPITIGTEPNSGAPIPYVPAQNRAAFPDRLTPMYLNLGANGLNDALRPDVQEPVSGGMRFLPGTEGYHMIHHRRAGVRCLTKPVFVFRMELYDPLATLTIGIVEDSVTTWLDEFDVENCTVFPGRVEYDLAHPIQSLKARLVVVSPAALPAYGMIGQLAVMNDRDEPRSLHLVALAVDGGEPARCMPRQQDQDGAVLRVACPRGLDFPGRTPMLHDANYDLLVTWDGAAALDEQLGAARPLDLPAKGAAEAYVIGLIDSPGYDAAEIDERIRVFYDRNPSLPENLRRRLEAESLETMVTIVVNGDQALDEIMSDAPGAFADCVANWDVGVYRTEPVSMAVPDPKLNSLLALTINDLYPGLVQPPGLCHDTKYGDPWHYIFAYRHVHGAVNVGLETAAIDYLRMLSTNQKPDGWIRSVGRDFFLQGAHPTSFEASYIDALHHYYKWTGDLAAVRELWPTLVRALDYIETSLNPDADDLYLDILHQWKSDADARGPSSSFQTALVAKAYADMAEFASLLSLPFPAKAYAMKAKRIRDAAQRELWSDERAMLGSKCPLGVLRLHPECLEVEIPVWTQLTDPWQSFVLVDWFLANCGFTDEHGGLWIKQSDWWPVMWSQAMIADGDSIMIARALMLAGLHDEGARILETVATSSYRSASPGFSYIVYPGGVYLHSGIGGMDPATVLGALSRATVETLFGVEPHLDEKRLVIRPRFPSCWNHAEFERPGLSMRWRRDGATQILKIRTAEDVQSTVVIPVRSPVRAVRTGSSTADYTMTPGMKHALLEIEVPAGGGEVAVELEEQALAVEAPATLRMGETATIRVSGTDSVTVDDRFNFFTIVRSTNTEVQVQLTKTGSGRATLFLTCRLGNVEWIEPVVFSTLPSTAAEAFPRTVAAALPEDAVLIPVDLTDAYTEDIQRCFHHSWKWDHGLYVQYQGPQGNPDYLQFLFQPVFRLTEPLDRDLSVEGIPFRIGPMGPGAGYEDGNDLIMLANTEPYPLPTTARIDIGRRLHKLYLLSLNMHPSMKSYVPAVEVAVVYTDGTMETRHLITPVNFDSYEQDFGINTAAFPLTQIEALPMPDKYTVHLTPQHQHHLTMTDIVCDSAREVASVEFRSVATETFFGLAGITLAAVDD